jgi:hypothetical protein
MPLTLTLSRKGRGLMKRKGFNDTPHFGSLPQGERKENRKDFNSTLTLALSRWWRGLMKRKEFMALSLLFSPAFGRLIWD